MKTASTHIRLILRTMTLLWLICMATIAVDAGQQQTVGPWTVETGVTWHTIGHGGETGYLGVRHEDLPGEQFIIRAPEYANLYKSLLLIPARWTWLDDSTLNMEWAAPREIQDEHQVARTAVFRFGNDFIDIVATVRNCSDRDWGSDRYDMFDVMTREAPLFRDDPAGEKTYVYRKDQFVPVGGFPIKDLKKNLMGSLSLATNREAPGELQITERLMAKVSDDGEWVLGIASDNAAGISFNLDPGTGCIHQNPSWGRLKAGEQRQTHIRVYLIRGTLDDLRKRYRDDFASAASASDSQHKGHGQATGGGLLRELWRTRLGVNSPTNVIVRPAG